MAAATSALALAAPEVDSDGNVVRGHKAESNRFTLAGEALFAFSFLLVGLLFSSSCYQNDSG